ncbi:MAG: hypothetical protein ACLUD2_11185 [Clostridium sp.]
MTQQLTLSSTSETSWPCTDEELVEMSELDLEGLKEAASKISIEDAAARAGK